MKLKLGPRASMIILLVTSLAGALFIGGVVLDRDPMRKMTRFQILIPESGGLLDDSPVMINGKVAGKVRSMHVEPGGLRVEGEYDSRYKVSAQSLVEVANLSLAGEQYINFVQPASNVEPYITNGEIINNPGQIHISRTVGDTLTQVLNLTGQLDPKVLDDITSTADEIFRGLEPQLQDLRQLVTQLERVVNNHGSQLGGILINVQVSLDLVQILIREMPQIAEKFRALDGPVTEVVGMLNRLGVEMTPDKYAQIERALMTFDRYLSQLVSRSHPFLMALKPWSTYIRTKQFDPGSTVDMLLRMLPQDGVPRLVLNMAG